jgi:hypothetical protein
MTCFTCSVKNWFDDPLPERANALDWFLFAGLLVVAVVAWNLILHDLKLE